MKPIQLIRSFSLFVGAVVCLSLLSSKPVLAASADMNLTPTRVVFDKGERYAVVNIKNAGDGVGRYHIEIADTEMLPNGTVKLLEEGQHSPFSAASFISIAPRSITLNPDDYQTIRILLKNQDQMTDGEYRAAIKVTMTETDLDPKTLENKKDATGIIIRPRLVMAIPLIINHGSSTYHVSIDDAKFVQSDGKDPHPQVQVDFGLEGTRSVFGDIKVTHVDENGKDTLLKLFPGIAIYRGVSKVSLTIPLEVPEGVNIHSGKTTVSYVAKEKEGGGVLAQRDVTP